jgi:magnesium-protoporphyrin O-methyltransferase
VVREYFNNFGFQRWRKIHGETDDVNRVQMDIRHDHSKTVENVLKMLKDEGSLEGVSVCDAGCGTGSLAIPLAKEKEPPPPPLAHLFLGLSHHSSRMMRTVEGVATVQSWLPHLHMRGCEWTVGTTWRSEVFVTISLRIMSRILEWHKIIW